MRIPFTRENTEVEEIATGVSSALESEQKTPSAKVEADLTNFKQDHEWDPNLPQEDIGDIDKALQTGDGGAERALEAALVEEDSPYPEVRAAVRNYDDDVPYNTPRAWIIGMLWTTIGSGVNMLFSLRQPSISLTPIVTLLLSYPFGIFWTAVMPQHKFRTFGYTWTLNPGPFSLKEQTIIVIMANASFGGSTAYSTDVLLAQEVYYGQKFGWGYQILLTLTCQMLGLGLAGLTRKWLVEPAAMVWPSNLVLTTLMETIHTKSTPDFAKTSGWKIGRYKWFLILMVVIFVWEWFPLFIAPFLAAFTFISWAAPNNVPVNQIFGGQSGLGLIPLTFDWSTITAFLSSPMTYPFHAIGNTMLGVVVFFIITAVGMQYNNSFYQQYLPMSSQGSFDNTAASYDAKRILNPDFTLDLQKYQEYSPLFLSTTFSLSYGLSFASITALIVHTGLFHGKYIWKLFNASREEGADIHTRLMLKYKVAPVWWYAVSFLVMFALGLVTCLVWDTHLKWWAFIIALLIAGFFYLPIGIVQATSNVQLGLNLITEFIAGYMLPGLPLATMMFKMYGYITCSQGLSFTQDLKLAHYMKVPQRTTFWAMFIATAWSCIVQIAVYNWAMGSIKDVCTPHQADSYTCPGARVFFTASIIWGLIGPQRIFGPDGIYHPLLYLFILGAVLPVVFWLLMRKFPGSPLRYVNIPVVFGGTGNIPPATVLNYGSWGIIGYIFNKHLKNRHPGWWTEYNYITSAALDCGTIICVLLIFFALQLPNGITPPQWWGGSGGGYQNNADWNSTPRVVLPEGQIFGPPRGSW